MTPVKEKKHTIEDYKILPEGIPYQLIEGELILTPAPNPIHQAVSANIFEKLRQFTKEMGLALYSPVDVYLGEENAYQPDIVYVSKEKKEIIKTNGIYGSPDLVIEILSPSTAYYDLRKKYRVYEKFGVQEYWIVDPEMRSLEIYFSQKGHFSLTDKAECEGEVASSILNGFHLKLESMFQVF